jgi:hypothetical protein
MIKIVNEIRGAGICLAPAAIAVVSWAVFFLHIVHDAVA